MSSFEKLYREYLGHLILEFSESAILKIIKKFANDASEREIRREIADFEKYKNSLQKKDPFQYKTWIEFTEAIHAAKGKAEFKKGTPKEDITANQEDIIADDENVTIYKTDSEDKCVLYGKGYSFCISRAGGGNMYNNYRLSKDSTFYFIYFKKKPKERTDHIMVLDITKNGYEWTFADNNTRKVDGGWKEIVSKYPEIAPYENLLTNKKLDDEERGFLNRLRSFTDNTNIDTFNTFNYKEKAQALKTTPNIGDSIWDSLDSVLRNEFLSIGPNLTKHQADDLKDNEIKRYKTTRAISFNQLEEAGEIRINKYDDIDNILSRSQYAYEYALNILGGKNVPDSILNVIAESRHYSYQYIKLIGIRGREIPDVILKSVAKSSMYSYQYAADILGGENVPDIIIKGISENSDYAHRYATFLKGENVPDIIIYSMAEDQWNSTEYAIEVLQGFDVPDVLLDTISQNAYNAHRYAHALLRIGELLENIPSVIIDGIASDPLEALQFATQTLDYENVPESILNSIAFSPSFAMEYSNGLEPENIPDVIINSIAANISFSLYFAKNRLKGINVPDVIIRSIATNQKSAEEYAEFLREERLEIPDIILKAENKKPLNESFNDFWINMMSELIG